MPRRGKRHRLGVGLWSDDAGRLSATVKVGSQPQREKIFKSTGDRDADLRRMQRWQLHTRAELLGDQPLKASRDSLVASVPGFLATMPEGSRRHDYEKLLVTWTVTPLGEMPRHLIRRAHVLTQLALWETEGYAATTLNHRVRALRKLYDVLDADDEYAVNPCAKIPHFTEPEPEERGTTYDILEGILACIPDMGFAATRGSKRPAMNKSKIRLRVMAWTGLPPAQIRKIQPEHIRWTEKELDVMPRRKGKGVKSRRLPLLEEAVAALRDMQAAGAFGTFSNAAPWTAWQRAKKRYLAQQKATLPADAYDALARVVMPLRPYDLRHSFLSRIYEQTTDLLAVRELGIHATITTSQRYVKRAAVESAKRAIGGWGARVGQTPVPPLADSGRKRATSLRAVHHDKPAKPRVSSKK